MRRASMVTLILTLMISALSGCSDDSTTAPTEQAPTPPNPAQLSVPLHFSPAAPTRPRPSVTRTSTTPTCAR